VRTFLTVATSIAEAEAHIANVHERFWKRAIKMWTELHTLPATNPLRNATSRIRKFRRYNRLPFYEVAVALNEIPMEELETINPFTLAPWVEWVQTIVDEGDSSGTTQADLGWAVRAAVSMEFWLSSVFRSPPTVYTYVRSFVLCMGHTTAWQATAYVPLFYLTIT
jgi:hypothetical protein